MYDVYGACIYNVCVLCVYVCGVFLCVTRCGSTCLMPLCGKQGREAQKVKAIST